MVQKEVAKYSDFQIDGLIREVAHRAPSFSQFALPREAYANSGKIQHLVKLLPKLRAEVSAVMKSTRHTA